MWLNWAQCCRFQRNVPLHFSKMITTLGVTLDNNLTLNQHVHELCNSLHFHPSALRDIRRAITDSIAATVDGASLVHSGSGLDYANPSLYEMEHQHLILTSYSAHRTSWLVVCIVHTMSCHLRPDLMLCTGCQFDKGLCLMPRFSHTRWVREK